jgi:hypothetical protein
LDNLPDKPHLAAKKKQGENPASSDSPAFEDSEDGVGKVGIKAGVLYRWPRRPAP